MDQAPEVRTAQTAVVVWDIPLRLWHWCFACAVAGALVTGLLRDVTLMQWHQRCGWAALGLLVWRLGWGFWGSGAARWGSFKATLSGRPFAAGEPPAEIGLDGQGVQSGAQSSVRSRPGALLGLALPFFVLLQASAGLFTSDFIFNEGPLVRHVSEAWVDVLSSLHHRLYWVVIALVSLHLSAHLVYALRRDAVVLGMFTGRKRLTVAPADHHLWRAALWTLSVAALLAASIWAL